MKKKAAKKKSPRRWIVADEFTPTSDEGVYHQRIRRKVFFPVGSEAAKHEGGEEELVDVYYISAKGTPPKARWVQERLSKTGFPLFVSYGFDRYSHPENRDTIHLCRSVTEETIIDGLSSKPEQLEVYQTHGYAPFFGITRIRYYREAAMVIISGTVDIDPDLKAKGVDIQISEYVTVGYAGDFDAELRVPPSCAELEAKRNVSAQREVDETVDEVWLDLNEWTTTPLEKWLNRHESNEVDFLTREEACALAERMQAHGIELLAICDEGTRDWSQFVIGRIEKTEVTKDMLGILKSSSSSVKLDVEVGFKWLVLSAELDSSGQHIRK